MTTGAVEGRVGMPGAIPEGSGQKPREYGSGAANVTGRKATHWPEAATGLMERIVSRGNMMAATPVITPQMKNTSRFFHFINVLRLLCRLCMSNCSSKAPSDENLVGLCVK